MAVKTLGRAVLFRVSRLVGGHSRTLTQAISYHCAMGALSVLVASACISAPVSYAAPPDFGAPSIPWIHAGPISGYLFYYGAPGPWASQPDRVLITPRGGIPGGYRTKILWHVRGGSGTITLNGRRLDKTGRFRQQFPAISGGYFPSIVVVPTVGCWRMTVRSGRRMRRFAFLAVAP
jgi:hypothetical protein